MFTVMIVYIFCHAFCIDHIKAQLGLYIYSSVHGIPVQYIIQSFLLSQVIILSSTIISANFLPITIPHAWCTMESLKVQVHDLAPSALISLSAGGAPAPTAPPYFAT